ncbi:hypothetical protein V7182_21670 [Neobacillus drentensis]|uniref:hypothetical protein n=1 Tax=Neobacillus drentensis TaxID=220684 RepID=UPI002FFF0ABB
MKQPTSTLFLLLKARNPYLHLLILILIKRLISIDLWKRTTKKVISQEISLILENCREISAGSEDKFLSMFLVEYSDMAASSNFNQTFE